MAREAMVKGGMELTKKPYLWCRHGWNPDHASQGPFKKIRWAVDLIAPHVILASLFWDQRDLNYEKNRFSRPVLYADFRILQKSP
jgi:hypothetical protein